MARGRSTRPDKNRDWALPMRALECKAHIALIHAVLLDGEWVARGSNQQHC